MRKTAIAGALACALVYGHARAEDPQKKQAEAQQEVGKAKAQASEDVSKAQADAQKKVSEAKKDAQSKEADARQDAAKESSSSKHPVFSKGNFDVKGKVANATASSVTLHREGLPDAKLDIDRNTKIEVDGNRVSAGQLKPGQDVHASFNLENDKPMAVEIKAKKAGGASSPTDRSHSTTNAH